MKKRKKKSGVIRKNNAMVRLPHCAAVRADELERYLFYIFRSAENSVSQFIDMDLKSIDNVALRNLTKDVLLIGKFLGRKYSRPLSGNGKSRRNDRYVRLLCDRKNRQLRRLDYIQTRELDASQYPSLLR